MPTNSIPQVSLAWDLSPDTTVTNYFLYYGVASGNYTNKIAVGNFAFISVSNLVRGTKYFFAVTASDGNLESVFSNEVNYTPKLIAPVSLHPPVTLVVQSKASVTDSFWADAGMDWSIDPTATNAVYRLAVRLAPPAATVNTVRMPMVKRFNPTILEELSPVNVKR